IGFKTVRENIDENGVEAIVAQKADHVPGAGFFVQQPHAVDRIALAQRILKPLPAWHVDRIASSARRKPAKLDPGLAERRTQPREDRIGPADVRTDKVSTFHGQNLVAHLARETRLRGNNSLEALLRYIGGQWIYRRPVYRNRNAAHFGYEGYMPSYNRGWCSPFCQFSRQRVRH